MRATFTKATSTKKETAQNSDQKKPRVKEADPDKVNEFIKTVVTGGRTTDESENEGW